MTVSKADGSLRKQLSAESTDGLSGQNSDGDPLLNGPSVELLTPRSVGDLQLDDGELSPEPADRVDRNVYVHNGTDFRVVAGFMQYGRTSVVTFYQWLDIVLRVESPWALFASRKSEDDSSYLAVGKPLPRECEGILHEGNYLLLCLDGSPCDTRLAVAPYMQRLPTGRNTPIPSWKQQVADLFVRYKQCSTTGAVIFDQRHTAGFEAAHIVPLAHRARWETLVKEELTKHSHLDSHAEMESFDNLLLMDATAHRLFCAHQLTFDPYDSWRILHFAPSLRGRTLSHLRIREPTEVDAHREVFLRDHYEQTILCNVRGDGSDTLGGYHYVIEDCDIDLRDPEWLTGQGKVYIELQFATRLYHASFDELRPNVWEREEERVVDHYDLASPPRIPTWASWASPSHPEHHRLKARHFDQLDRCYEKRRKARPFENFGME